jgi:DHA1 family tetracycline resistance protein-like MFS transporter
MGILFLVVLVDMLGLTLVIPFLTYFVQDLASAEGIVDAGNRDFWVGIVIATYSLAQFISTPILGAISDRIGRRPVLMFGLAANSIFFIVFGLSGSLSMAVIARFLAGAGNGNIAVAKAYIGDISEDEEVAARMGMLGAAFGLGFMIGPFIGGILSDPATGFGGPFDSQFWMDYPYLLPCIFSSAMSAIALMLAIFKLPESLPPESRSESKKSPLNHLGETFSRITSVMRMPIIASLVNVNFLFLIGFTMMHGTFILFTSMDPESGGLGWSERDNGWAFAFVGLLGVIVQGGMIRPLTRRFSLRGMMIVGTALAGLGISSIPYASPEISWLIFGSCAGFAIGNGIFMPMQGSLLTFATKDGGYELGTIMGAQEGLGALARIIGPFLSAVIWSSTVEGSGLWSYHTCFRVSGLFFLVALLLQLRLRAPGGANAQTGGA